MKILKNISIFFLIFIVIFLIKENKFKENNIKKDENIIDTVLLGGEPFVLEFSENKSIENTDKKAKGIVGFITFKTIAGQKQVGLGHKTKFDISNSSIYKAKTTGIDRENIKSRGHITVSYDTAIPENQKGKNIKETDYGICWDMEKETDLIDKYLIDILKKENVQIGKAEIFLDIENGNIEPFEIEITELNPETNEYFENGDFFNFIVTDNRLLNLSGGLATGMSGSPIVQNGKLIGAVSGIYSVIPMINYNGYGVYAEDMYNSFINLEKNY